MSDQLLRGCIRQILQESVASDAYEVAVASAINNVAHNKFFASAAGGDVRYADVRVDVPSIGSTYVEVKMGHKDNLANPRISFNGQSWESSSMSPVAKQMIELASSSPDVNQFILDLKKFMGLKPNATIKIPTTKGGLKDPVAVPLETMRAFVENRGNRYITKQSDIDVGNLVTQHYLKGKVEPANYIQAGDDFYVIGRRDPLGLRAAMALCGVKTKIPKLGGTGIFNLRVSTRSQFYEIQPEIKITNFKPASSPVSVMGTGKPNPFECLAKQLTGKKEDE